VAVIMIGTHVAIMRSKKPTEPGSPVTSAYAYGLFVRAQSAFLVALGILLSAGMGISFVLSAAQIISLEQMTVIILAIAALAIVGSLVLTFVYGQAGSRLYQRMGDRFAEDELSFDDDEHWKLGIFYWNKDDASVFLPKRFGFGWTVNLARPATWAIIAGLIAVTVIFVAISFAVAE